MEGFSFVTPVTGLNRHNTGKEDDDDDMKPWLEVITVVSVYLLCEPTWPAL
jgi:hypothetical protein